MNYSYLMGVKDITELKNNGFIVEEINGNYGIKFEKDKAKFYEEEILNLCCKFAECIFPSLKQMLEDNSFYAKNYFNKL